MDNNNQKLTLNNGWCLGYAEYGISTRKPVFHFHGAGSSRLERPAVENILKQINIRFVSVDRPGHGLSNFQPNRQRIDWPNNIAQPADHLRISQFYLTGHSAGGPYVLTRAHRLPERVIAGAVMSRVAPMSRSKAYEGMPFLNQLLARSSRQLPWFTKLICWIMQKIVAGEVEKATRQQMSSIPASDKEIIDDPKNIEILVSSIREGFVKGIKELPRMIFG